MPLGVRPGFEHLPQPLGISSSHNEGIHEEALREWSKLVTAPTPALHRAEFYSNFLPGHKDQTRKGEGEALTSKSRCWVMGWHNAGSWQGQWAPAQNGSSSTASPGTPCGRRARRHRRPSCSGDMTAATPRRERVPPPAGSGGDSQQGGPCLGAERTWEGLTQEGLGSLGQWGQEGGVKEKGCLEHLPWQASASGPQQTC